MNYDKLTKEQIISIQKDVLEYAEEKDKEIERLNNIIDNFLKYLRGNEKHWKESTRWSWDGAIYGQLADYLERRLKDSDKE